MLAKVGSQPITLSQLRAFEQRLPPGLKTRKTGEAATMDYLQTLIDKEVYLQEARKRGLDQDPAFLRQVQKEHIDHVLKVFFDQALEGKIVISPEELQAHFVKTQRDRAIRVREIVVENQQRAEEMLRKLKAGADFAELARKNSLHQPTAERGGELRGYSRKDEVLPFFREKVFPLKKGEFTPPITLPNGYSAIFQIMDEKPVEMESVRNVLEGELFQDKSAAMMATISEQLREELHLRPDQAAIQALVEKIGGGAEDFSPAERAAVLYQFDGGQITAGDFLDLALEMGLNAVRARPERVLWFANQVLAPRMLCLASARKAGLDKDPATADWLARRTESLLLQALRRSEVADQVRIGETEVRQFYTQRPELFVPLTTLTVQELLVKSEEEARAFRERIERGEDLGKLAEANTLRAMGKLDQGKFHIHSFESAEYGELFEAAREAPVGQLMGPLAIEVPPGQLLGSGQTVNNRYFSVFKLLDSTGGKDPEPFDKVAKRAEALLRRDLENRIAERFRTDLLRQYEAQITINKENIVALQGK
ncbi:MAG: peptidyl-prolyl cis-trans isomerase [Candidatus Latescibacteria bacterium]|nr:peptidyl-prolyl cis-trans isomerase [Candidatus Latescibacterota bacterium]